MKQYKWMLITANLVLLLVFFNRSVFQKEKTLSNGTLILLELAPVDPRSLMQGDYMDLRYAMQDGNGPVAAAKRGYCIVKTDESGVGKCLRLQTNKAPLSEGEHLVEYTSSDWRINIGAGSYFFEEGQSEKFAVAKYGGIKVDEDGKSVLVGLYDKDKKLITN